MNCIYLLFIVEILLFIFAFFVSGQDIMAPSVVMSGMFVISTLAALLLGRDFQVRYGFDSFLILSLGIFTFILSESIFRLFYQRNLTAAKKKQLLSEQQTVPFVAVSVQKWMLNALVIYDAIMMVWYTRVMVSFYGGIGGVVRYAARVTYVDYSDYLFNPVQMVLLNVVAASGSIAAFLLCQQIIARTKNGGIVQLLIIMVLSQWQSVVGGARGNIIRFLCAVLIEYYILWHQKNGWHRNLSWKYLRIGLACILAGIPLFYYSRIWMGRPTTATMSEHTLSYLGQSIWLFDNFVKNPTKPIVFGEESLIGVHRFIRRFLGIYVYTRDPNLEVRKLAPGYTGNVYSFFRRPLHDFGIIGMIVFTVLVSLLFSSIYYGKIKWKKRTIRTDCWCLIYGAFYYWMVVSSMVQYSWYYLSAGSAVLIFAIVLGYRMMTGFRVTFARRRRIQ